MAREALTEEDEEIRWARERAIMSELQAKRDAMAAAEREHAYAAVQAALSSYRWWGWTNIINSIRVAIQGWRLRRAKGK